jgi:flavin-binding protein dodecin
MQDFDFDDFERPATFEGLSREGLQDAIADAVSKANKPNGTWLRVTSIEVLSVEDPNVGGYRVILGPTG